MQITRLRATNFKSLKEIDIPLSNLSVLVGPNASGKTNVLELLKFMTLCIKPPGMPSYPFTPWWGYNNIVSGGKEETPISFGIDFRINQFDVSYNGVVTGYGGQLRFIQESLDIKDLIQIKREANLITIIHESKFLNSKKVKEGIERIKYHPITGKKWSLEDLNRPQIVKNIPESISMMTHLRAWSWTHSQNDEFGYGTFNIKPSDADTPVSFISPVDDIQLEHPDLILLRALGFFQANVLVFIRHLNRTAIRQPSQVGAPMMFGEDGAGLVNQLFTWFNQLGGKLPDRIDAALRHLFPDWQITFTITEDGRVFMNVKEGDIILQPPSIPDGLYSLLAILAAIELKPKILLIDEIETSLHAKLINYILDSLRNSDSTCIVSTHSPIVIDLSNLEELVLLEKQGHATKVQRINYPDKVRQKLNEQGLTQSESWIYGSLK